MKATMARCLVTVLMLGVVLGCASIAGAQTCPAAFDRMRLSSSFYMVANLRSGGAPVCGPAEGGGTTCRAACVYVDQVQPQNSLGVDWAWYTSPSANGRPRIGGMCVAEQQGMLTVPGRQISVRLNPKGDISPARAQEIGRTLVGPWAQQAIACPAPPTPPPVTPPLTRSPDPGKVVGRVVGFSGELWLVPRDGRARARAEINYPLVLGDRIITGANSRARLEFAEMDVRSLANPTVINLSSDTEVLVASVHDELFRARQPGGNVFELLRGMITWFTRGWTGDSNFSVRSGSTVCGIRGTEFAARYDPATDMAEYYLNSGLIELRNGSQVRQLTPGQSVAIARNHIGLTQPLDPNTWIALVDSARTTAGANPGAAGGTSEVLRPSAARPTRIMFGGRTVDATYEQQVDARGVPIDVYFYRTTARPGAPLPVGVQEWNKFVRVPAAGSNSSEPVVWWHSHWEYGANGWQYIQEQGIAPPQTLR